MQLSRRSSWPQFTWRLFRSGSAEEPVRRVTKEIRLLYLSETMSYRKHGVRIESCFKETALKDVEASIKLSRYR